MAIITQAGVDKLTQATRAQFDAENKRRLRQRRLRQAATGNYQFDPREQAVEMERLGQQAEDLNAEQQAVRQRYATDPVFGGPTQLFDASNIIDLPAAVLQRHGNMSRSEMVKTEKDRINGGGRSGWTFDPETGQTKSNGWKPEDDLNAGAALGSRPMMQKAWNVIAPERDAEAQRAKAQQMREGIADARSRGQAARAKRVVKFDEFVARGDIPADNAMREKLAGRERPMFSNRGSTEDIRNRTFGDFGDTGGEISRGGETFRTAPGMVGEPKYRAPVRTTSALSPVKQSDSFMPKGVGQTYEAPERPNPYAGLDSMPRPAARAPVAPAAPVFDNRYQGFAAFSRTGAKALAAPAIPEDPALFTRDHPNLAAFNDLAGMRSVDPWLDAASGAWGDIKSKAAKPKRVFDAWSESQHEAELRRQTRMRASQRPRPQSIAGPRSSLYGVRQAPSFAVASGY